jgi:hypothetical protein
MDVRVIGWIILSPPLFAHLKGLEPLPRTPSERDWHENLAPHDSGEDAGDSIEGFKVSRVSELQGSSFEESRETLKP